MILNADIEACQIFLREEYKVFTAYRSGEIYTFWVNMKCPISIKNYCSLQVCSMLVFLHFYEKLMLDILNTHFFFNFNISIGVLVI